MQRVQGFGESLEWVDAYLKFAQRSKVFEDAEQHYDEILVTNKTLHISLASFRFAAYLMNFLLIK